MSPAKFLSFAKRFGEVVEYPFIKGIEGFAEIIPVLNKVDLCADAAARIADRDWLERRRLGLDGRAELDVFGLGQVLGVGGGG